LTEAGTGGILSHHAGRPADAACSSGASTKMIDPGSPSSSRNLVVELRGEERPRGKDAGPLARVCGLPVLVRNLLVLRRAGYETALLVCAPDDREALESALAPHRHRVGLEIAILESEAPLLSALAPILRPAASHLLWPGALSFGRFAPQLATAEVAADKALAGSGGAEGLALLGENALRSALERGETIEALLERMLGEGSAREVTEEAHPAFRIQSRAARDQAERALLVSLRKPVDGAVAKFDRYVSLVVSRRLMKLPITPSQVTVVAGLIGIACGVRLDTWADDSSNLAFMVGACVGCYRTWGWSGYLVLGAVTGGGLLITAALMYHYVITVAHSGDLNDFKMPWEEQAARAGSEPEAKGGFAGILARLKFIVRRDTFVFLTTIFAVAGQLRVMTWFYAAGASSVWVAIVVYRVLLPAARRRHAQ